MANALYDKAREKFLKGLIDWTNDTIKAVLLDSSEYTVNLATDEFLDDIPQAARFSFSTPLSNKTTSSGIAGADTVTFDNVAGPSCEAVVLYVDTGDESTSSLIAYIDTAMGLPIIPNSSDIVVNWSNGRIFKL